MGPQVERRVLAVPQPTAQASWGWLSRLLAARCGSRSGPMAGLQCGPKAQPESPIPRRATPRWKEMSADDKKEYDEMAATDKQRYIDDMKAYKEKKRAEAAGDDASEEEEEEAPASVGGAAADNASDDE